MQVLRLIITGTFRLRRHPVCKVLVVMAVGPHLAGPAKRRGSVRVSQDERARSGGSMRGLRRRQRAGEADQSRLAAHRIAAGEDKAYDTTDHVARLPAAETCRT
jgi:hypothetical protein